MTFENQFVVLRPLDIDRDIAGLFEAASLQNNGRDIFVWFINVGPIEEIGQLRAFLEEKLQNETEVVYTVYSKRLQKLVGCASLMESSVKHGRTEIGSIWYSAQAQRSEINTAVMRELFTYVFETLAYRRLEWKCNTKNSASAAAAMRLGFAFEGIFRQHYVSRGQNRDTAWYSILDSEWPRVKQNIEGLLARAR